MEESVNTTALEPESKAPMPSPFKTPVAMSVLETIRSGDVVANPQSQAALFRLPAEVRWIIFSHVFEGNALHLSRGWCSAENNAPYCSAHWCFDNPGDKQGCHPACDSLHDPARILSLPLACRQLYIETIQSLYSRYTLHIRDEDVLIKWASLTPKLHLDVVTSLRAMAVQPDSEDDIKEYAKIWNVLSDLPSLKDLQVKIIGSQTQDEWDSTTLQRVLGPIKRVQQESLEQFDIVFDIQATWFPEDCYLRINYNCLRWDTFLIDQEKRPEFKGIHPRCRVIGMQSFVTYHPILDDMPTEAELIQWLFYFSCNSAYGYDEPEGYDSDEVGESALRGVENWEERRDEGRKLWDKLKEEYEEIGGREKWSNAAINRVVDMMDSENQRPMRYRWTYPERPSWIKEKTDKVNSGPEAWSD